MMEIIKHGKNVYMTADGHNVSKAVKEILTRDKPKGKAEPSKEAIWARQCGRPTILPKKAEPRTYDNRVMDFNFPPCPIHWTAKDIEKFGEHLNKFVDEYWEKEEIEGIKVIDGIVGVKIRKKKAEPRTCETCKHEIEPVFSKICSHCNMFHNWQPKAQTKEPKK